MSKTTITKIPVLSEKSALSIFGRVLSGKRKVRIGEIGRLPLSSAALGEHIVHRARLGCARRAYCTPSLYTEQSQYVHRAEPRCTPTASRLHSTSILYTEPVHRAEPICTPSGAEVSVLLFFNQCIHKCNDFCNLLFRQIQFFRR